MSNEVVLINGVTKREDSGNFVYDFPRALITVNSSANTYEIAVKDNRAQSITAKFSDTSQNFGQSNSEELIDEYARLGFFFETSDLNQILPPQPGSGEFSEHYQMVSVSELKSIRAYLSEILMFIKSIAE